MRRVLFYRDFQGLTGGHLKVWHYFAHLASSPRFRPEIYFAPGSRLDASNPWIANGVTPLDNWTVDADDIVFLAGLDWQMVPDREGLARSKAPVVNLIQGLRHADPDDPRWPFLQRAATRICVSQEVADAIRNTGRVNGPIFTVRAGIALDELPRAAINAERDIPLLISGVKNPGFANEVGRALTNQDIEHRLVTEWRAREQYLKLLQKSSSAIILPLNKEGFFLPALEAMALRTLLICPDCVGNRGHCIDGINCLRPAYTVGDVVAAVLRLVSLSESERGGLLNAAAATVHQHSLEAEREKLLCLFARLPGVR